MQPACRLHYASNVIVNTSIAKHVFILGVDAMHVQLFILWAYFSGLFSILAIDIDILVYQINNVTQ